jgi:hypothetical protein
MIKRYKDVKYIINDANTQRYQDFGRFVENSYRLIIPDININFVVYNADNVVINPNFDIEAVIKKLYNVFKIGFRVVRLKVTKSTNIFYDYSIEYIIPEIDNSFYSLNAKMKSDNINKFNYQLYYNPEGKDWREIIGAYGFDDHDGLSIITTSVCIDFPVLGLFKPDRIKVKPSLCHTCKYYCPSDVIDCAVNPSFPHDRVFECKDWEFTKYPNWGEMYDELA